MYYINSTQEKNTTTGQIDAREKKNPSEKLMKQTLFLTPH